MNRSTSLTVVVLLGAFIALGCSSGGKYPVTPVNTPQAAIGPGNHQAQTHLWGYYDVSIDIETLRVVVVPDRQAMFMANVVNFLNNATPPGLSFHINDVTITNEYIDIDIDVGITHPFPGFPKFNGYDVRGVFMGDGSSQMAYNNDLVFPILGTDQFMLPDPDNGIGGPDGYTRWFNFTEFSTGGMPLFSYTQGNLASPGFAGTASLCPYKYFANGLGAEEDLWSWLNGHAAQHGEFTSGATNDRNYYIRFPKSKGVTFGYAILANWEGLEPEYHPANAPEAPAVDVFVTDSIFYIDDETRGGSLILDIDVFGWEYQPSTIWIESTVLSYVASFDPWTISTGGTENYMSYHVAILADNIMGTEGNEFWVIAEYEAFNYTNEFGVENGADTDFLAAFFRYDLEILTEPPECRTTVLCIDPTCAFPESFLDDAIICCTEIMEGPNLDARLRMTDQPDIVGTDLTIVDNTTLTADFDLIGAEGGAWDVVVTNGCGGIPGVGEEMFTISTEDYDFHLIDSGYLPGPLPTSDLEFLDFCVVGNMCFGNEGVYYHYATGEPPPGDAIYKVFRYPLDYSGGGKSYVTLDSAPPWNWTFNGLMGGPQYMAAIEVPPMGGVVFTSRFPGPIEWGGYPGDGPVWWCAPDNDGVLTNGYIYFNMRFFDLETEFGLFGDVWGYWGNEYGAGVDGATFRLDDPYELHLWTNIDGFYPVDHNGSVDCLVSDMEAHKHAIDSDPQGLDEPFDRIFYYMEGHPDDNGIEIIRNNHDVAMPECIGTIDNALVGTPVDISCLNTNCHIVDAAGNWLCVLEDNGDSTWQVAIFDQNGVLIDRYPTPLDGDAFALDCDSEHLEIHVWFVHGDAYNYAVFGLSI